MDAYANVLLIFTVAISSIDNMAVTIHRPQLSQISSNHLYLPYNADGPGNYDGTKELTQEDIGGERMKNKLKFFYLMKIIINSIIINFQIAIFLDLVFHRN